MAMERSQALATPYSKAAKDLQARKQEMETELLACIMRFERDTGLGVDGIDTDRVQAVASIDTHTVAVRTAVLI